MPVFPAGPADAYKSVVALGAKKASQPASRILLLGIMAGFQVGIGAAMAIATLGGVPLIQEQNPGLAKILFGISGLPCSLLMVLATVRFQPTAAFSHEHWHC